jgi:hypothetical protein
MDWQVLGNQVSCWQVLVAGKRWWKNIGLSSFAKNIDCLASHWEKKLSSHWATPLLQQLELFESVWGQMMAQLYLANNNLECV